MNYFFNIHKTYNRAIKHYNVGKIEATILFIYYCDLKLLKKSMGKSWFLIKEKKTNCFNFS